MSKLRIELDQRHAAKVQDLADRSGSAPDEIVNAAIDLYLDWQAAGGDFTPEQNAAIEAGLAAIERGEIESQEEVFAALDAKYGV